jgi:hypothetical protein
METTTQFDLEQAILEWRKTLANSPAIRGADLEELESHLRDSVERLQGAGLSALEAFLVARSRLGGYESLSAEFGKVNVEQVWMDRVLWMLTGCIALGLGAGFINSLVSFATLGIFAAAGTSFWLGPCSLILHVATLAALLTFLWRSGRNGEGAVWRTGRWLKARPVTAGVIVVLLTILSSAAVFGSNFLTARSMSVSNYSSLVYWRLPANFLFTLLYPALLMLLLRRRSDVNGDRCRA